jgi:hypothetical protein
MKEASFSLADIKRLQGGLSAPLGSTKANFMLEHSKNVFVGPDGTLDLLGESYTQFPQGQALPGLEFSGLYSYIATKPRPTFAFNTTTSLYAELRRDSIEVGPGFTIGSPPYEYLIWPHIPRGDNFAPYLDVIGTKALGSSVTDLNFCYGTLVSFTTVSDYGTPSIYRIPLKGKFIIKEVDGVKFLLDANDTPTMLASGYDGFTIWATQNLTKAPLFPFPTTIINDYTYNGLRKKNFVFGDGVLLTNFDNLVGYFRRITVFGAHPLSEIVARVTDENTGTDQSVFTNFQNMYFPLLVYDRATQQVFQLWAYGKSPTEAYVAVDETATDPDTYPLEVEIAQTLRFLNSQFAGPINDYSLYGLYTGGIAAEYRKYDFFAVSDITPSSFRDVTKWKGRHIFVGNDWNVSSFLENASAIELFTDVDGTKLIRMTLSASSIAKIQLGDYIGFAVVDAPTLVPESGFSYWKRKIPWFLVANRLIEYPAYTYTIRPIVFQVTGKSVTVNKIWGPAPDFSYFQNLLGYFELNHRPWYYNILVSWGTVTNIPTWLIGRAKAENNVYFGGYPGDLANGILPKLDVPWYVKSTNYLDFSNYGHVTAIEGTPDYLYVFTRDKILGIIGEPPVDIAVTGLNIDFRVRELYTDIGAFPYGVTKAENVVYFVGPQGIYSLIGERITFLSEQLIGRPEYSAILEQTNYVQAFTKDNRFVFFNCILNDQTNIVVIYDIFTKNFTFLDRQSSLLAQSQPGTNPYFHKPSTGTYGDFMYSIFPYGDYIVMPSVRNILNSNRPTDFPFLMSEQLSKHRTIFPDGTVDNYFKYFVPYTPTLDFKVVFPEGSRLKVKSIHTRSRIPFTNNALLQAVYGPFWFNGQDSLNIVWQVFARGASAQVTTGRQRNFTAIYNSYNQWMETKATMMLAGPIFGRTIDIVTNDYRIFQLGDVTVTLGVKGADR